MDAHHKLLGEASPEVWVKVMTNQPHHPILGHLSGAELGLRDANGFDSILLFFYFVITNQYVFIIELMKKHKHTKESKHTHYLVFLVHRGTNSYFVG